MYAPIPLPNADRIGAAFARCRAADAVLTATIAVLDADLRRVPAVALRAEVARLLELRQVVTPPRPDRRALATRRHQLAGLKQL